MPSLAADIEETKDEAWSKQVDVVSQVSKMLLQQLVYVYVIYVDFDKFY